MKIDIGYGNVFKRTFEAFNKNNKIVIHKGGTGSGKTFDIMVYLIFIFAMQPDKIITVVSESRPHLDIGVIRIMKHLLSKSGLIGKLNYNITQSRLTYPNGSIIEFFSADRIEKALGARRDMLFGNEINSLKFDIWDEMTRRSEYIIADFNPTSKFWLEDWLKFYDNYIIINSNYMDNPFLPEFEKQRISQRVAVDKNFKRVHIDNQYGIAEGIIFENWDQVDEYPEDAGDQICGLDFGFTNNPNALVRIGFLDKELYVDELLYQKGLTNQQIAEFIKTNTELIIIADSSEPKSIEEIYQYGIDIRSSVKGQGSVNYGIGLIKEYKMHVTKRSINIIKELRNYRWDQDKNGNPINKPVKMFDHSIDAIRYALMALYSIIDQEGIITYDERVEISNI